MLSKRRIRRICAARQQYQRAIRLLAYVALASAVASVGSAAALPPNREQDR